MPIEMTRIALGARDLLGEQLADTFTIANDSVSGALVGGIYKMRATGDCTARISTDAEIADASGGETWKADEIETRTIPGGAVVAVDA